MDFFLHLINRIANPITIIGFVLAVIIFIITVIWRKRDKNKNKNKEAIDENRYNKLVQLLEKRTVSEKINLQIYLIFKPTAVYDLYHKGENAYYNKNYDEAIEYYKKTIILQPNYAEAYYKIGMSLVCLGKNNYSLSLSYLEKAIEYKSNYADAYFEMGFIYQGIDNNKAINYYQQAINNNVDCKILANNNLGVAYFTNNEINNAIKSFNNALRVYDLELADVHTQLGLCYRTLSKTVSDSTNINLAIDNYKRAIELNPNSDCAYYRLGEIFFQLNKYDNAITELKKTIELNQDNGGAYELLGIIYYKKNNKDYQNIKTNLEKALKYTPNNIRLLEYLGSFYCDNGEYEAAISCIQRVIDIGTDNINALNLMGIIYSEMGQTKSYVQFDTAISYYEQAIELKPDFIAAYDNLGRLYLYMSDNINTIYYQKAIECCRKSANLGNEKAKQWLIDNNLELN